VKIKLNSVCESALQSLKTFQIKAVLLLENCGKTLFGYNYLTIRNSLLLMLVILRKVKYHPQMILYQNFSQALAYSIDLELVKSLKVRTRLLVMKSTKRAQFQPEINIVNLEVSEEQCIKNIKTF
jgi:hypothetical protein